MARWLSKEDHEKRARRVIELKDKYNLTFVQIAERMGMCYRLAHKIYYKFKNKNEEVKQHGF